MKKTRSLFSVIVLLLLSLSSCAVKYEENVWFSEEVLEELSVPALPAPTAKKMLRANDETVYLILNDDEYDAYLQTVYTYLQSCDFQHLGTAGDQVNTFVGLVNSYAFAEGEHVSDFYTDNGHYLFLFGNTAPDTNGNLECIALDIWHSGGYETIDYDDSTFTYNTAITLHVPDFDSYKIVENVGKTRLIHYANVEYLAEGSIVWSATVGEEVCIRTNPIMDVGLEVYVNGVKAEQTHADSDYWEYVFTMPNEDVYVTFKTVGEGPAPSSSDTFCLF